MQPSLSEVFTFSSKYVKITRRPQEAHAALQIILQSSSQALLELPAIENWWNQNAQQAKDSMVEWGLKQHRQPEESRESWKSRSNWTQARETNGQKPKALNSSAELPFWSVCYSPMQCWVKASASNRCEYRIPQLEIKGPKINYKFTNCQTCQMQIYPLSEKAMLFHNVRKEIKTKLGRPAARSQCPHTETRLWRGLLC